VNIRLRCNFFTDSACAGTFDGDDSKDVFISNPSGSWTPVQASLQSTASTGSAACSFVFVNPSGDFKETYLDNIHLIDIGPLNLDPIFLDGFESGDTSAWATTMP
jgi:hypothetical protein